MTRNTILAEAVGDLAALLDYAGRRSEAASLRAEIAALSSGRVRGLEALSQLNRIRGGIRTLQEAALRQEARRAAEDVVARIERALSAN